MLPTKPTEPDRLLRRLEWTVLRRLDGLMAGNYHTLFQGSGLDFAVLRPYEPGDDVRTLDWSATARQQEPYVRRYHEDRELDAWFVVDTSPSVASGWGGRTGSDVVAEAVGALAGLFARQGNRVGACLYDGGLPRLLPASAGRGAVLALLRALGQGGEASGETDLGVPLDALAGVLRRRSLVFVVSDFHGKGGWEPALGALALRHEVLALRVRDAGEAELPDLGTVWLQDSETGEQLLVDTGDRGFRDRLAEAAHAHGQAVGEALARARVDALTLGTDDDLVLALLGLARRRRLEKTRGGFAR